jgi:hypothetical protein
MYPVGIYSRASGEFIVFDPNNGIQFVEIGHAGRGEHKNQPKSSGVKEFGPLPKGTYSIAPPRDHPRLGPVALPLVPHPQTKMMGRSGFFIHGDSRSNPGQASHGCIILSKRAREAIVTLRLAILEVH